MICQEESLVWVLSGRLKLSNFLAQVKTLKGVVE